MNKLQYNIREPPLEFSKNSIICRLYSTFCSLVCENVFPIWDLCVALVCLNNILPPATLKLFISVLEFLTGSIFLWTCLLKYHFMIEPPKVHRFLFTLGNLSKKSRKKSIKHIIFINQFIIKTGKIFCY